MAAKLSILISVIIVVFGGILVFQLNSATKRIAAREEYQNPFDKTTQYKNPFEEYQNPINDLTSTQ